MEHLIFLGSPGVAPEDAERGIRDAITVRFSGSSSPPHPALQSGRHPNWGLCQLRLMGHLGGGVGGEVPPKKEVSDRTCLQPWETGTEHRGKTGSTKPQKSEC